MLFFWHKFCIIVKKANYMKKIILTATVLSTVLFTNCATIVSSSKTTVNIDATQGTNVTVTDRKGNEIYQGSTPCNVTLKHAYGFFQRGKYTVTATNNKQVQTRQIEAQLNGWYFGNIILGGVAGMLIIDPLTGAMYSISVDYLKFNFNTSFNFNEIPSQYLTLVEDK